MNASQQSAATRPHAGDAAAWLRVDFADPAAMLRFAFVDDIDDAVRVRCAQLAGPRAPECWRLGDGLRVYAQEVPEIEGDIEAATGRAYTKLLTAVRSGAQPHLVRIWNYLGAINDGAGDNERYRRFCVGRAAAADAAFNAEPPAATAIGHDGGAGVLQVVALCAATPAIALENPRQTPAWSYPREYGPVSPGFSRGALLDAGSHAPTLLASGTASIVGHVSQHVGDVAEQLRESLRNLDALLTVGSQRAGIGFHFERCQALRVYLRHAHDLPLAQAVIARSGLPSERVVYVRGDVCRRELDVEIEGVFGAG
ncbi:MAG: pteridine-dependent deoxygenase [Proteobacteria bacterium]|nr:pteridine-dependent deoxygenase [Pseudomonadota bacterium]